MVQQRKQSDVYNRISLICTLLLPMLLILVPILSFSAFASEEFENWNVASDSLLIQQEVTSTITVVPLNADYTIKSIDFDLSFYPREDYRQKNEMQVIYPNDYTKTDDISFRLSSPAETSFLFSVSSKVRTINIPVKIDKKVMFPIKNLGSEMDKYLKETELINYNNPAIIELASQIAEGKDDSYQIVFDLAVWTNRNIKYSLDTMTAEASLPASWVIENRKGVCDELTNLFIAMVRSIGIPAKFVAGISYTESELFSEPWGAHSWAEVYLPGYGWVPFDVTYGQYGDIDPTHIKLKESYDSDKTSSSFEWLGRDVDLKSNSMEMKTSILDYGSKIKPRIEIKNTLFKEEVGFGSYDLLITKVKNLDNYYLPVRISLAKIEGLNGMDPLDIVDEPTKDILLKPKEERYVYWRIKVNPLLLKNSVYTFPLQAYTEYDEMNTINLTARQNEVVLSEKDIYTILTSLEQGEEKTYLNELAVECSTDRQEYYLDEEVALKCRLKNDGNTNIKKLKVCAGDDGSCKVIELSIAQEKEIQFTKQYAQSGKQIILITAESEHISKTVKVEILAEERPKLEIKDITYPEAPRFSEPIEVKFLVSKETYSSPENVTIKMAQSIGTKRWDIPILEQSKEFSVTIPAYELSASTSEVVISAEYYDKEGKKYAAEQKFNIELEKLNIGENLRMMFNKISTDPTYAVIAGICIAVVLGFILNSAIHRKKKQ